MADKAALVENQIFSPKWQQRNDNEYYKFPGGVNFLNQFGTGDPARLPMRNLALPRLTLGRHPVSLRKLNVQQSRYHHPGGLEYHKVDFARVLNSSAKVAEVNNQEIRVNPGIWHHTGF